MANYTSKKNAKEERPKFSLKGMKVAGVRRLTDNVVAFSLIGNGMGLYGLKVVSGKNGKFISEPASKGKDDNFYPHYRIYLQEEDSEKLIKEVMNQLDDEDLEF